MQAPPVRDDGLQIQERRSFQSVFWTIERCAWFAFAVILLLAIAGLTGSGGYFAMATASYSSGKVEYPRVARVGTSDKISVTFNSEAETHRLTLDPAFYESFQVEGIQPQPERSAGTSEGIAMEFAAQPDASLEVVIYIRALRPGLAGFTAALDGAGEDLTTMVMP